MISGFVLNKELIKVTKNGSIDGKRDGARKIEGGEKRLEEEFTSKISTFSEVNSRSAKYLNSAFGNISLRLQDLKALTKVFARIINTYSPREAYRRKTTCYIWMDSHFDAILRALSQNELHVIVLGSLVRLNPEISHKTVHGIQQNTIFNVLSQQQSVFDDFEEEISSFNSIPLSMSNQCASQTNKKMQNNSYTDESKFLYEDFFDCFYDYL